MTCPKCAQMEEELALLKGGVREDADEAMLLSLQQTLRLTRGTARILAALWKAKTGVSDGTLADLGREYGEGSVSSVKTQICRLRKHLAPDSIVSIQRYGYLLTDKGRDQVEQILGPRINVQAVNDDEDTPLPVAVAVLCGRLAGVVGPVETNRILTSILRALEAQYSHA